MTGRSWVLFITLIILAMSVLIPFLRGSEFHGLFCEAFSGMNGFPKGKLICGYFEKMHVCKGVTDEARTFSCNVYSK